MARSTGRCSASVVCGALAAGAAAQPGLLWGEQFGTAQGDLASTVAPDGAGGLFIRGHTEGELFAPSAGGQDAFVARYGTANCPDFTGDGVLDLVDCLGYVNAFNAPDPPADCDGDGSLSQFDFLCFATASNEGR